MTSLFYDHSSVLIAAVLFIALMLAIEASRAVGKLFQSRVSESTRQHANAIRASLLTLVALLIGFTLAQSLNRFEARSAAVVVEANAIGTTYLRAKLTPDSIREQATNEQSTPVVALFVQSINELIDSFSRREAEIARHVPESIFLLLAITYLLTGAVIGISFGTEGQRAPMSSYVLALVIALLLAAIIDLDRPRRGLIEVPQDSLLDLQAAI